MELRGGELVSSDFQACLVQGQVPLHPSIHGTDVFGGEETRFAAFFESGDAALGHEAGDVEDLEGGNRILGVGGDSVVGIDFFVSEQDRVGHGDARLLECFSVHRGLGGLAGLKVTAGYRPAARGVQREEKSVSVEGQAMGRRNVRGWWWFPVEASDESEPLPAVFLVEVSQNDSPVHCSIMQRSAGCGSVRHLLRRTRRRLSTRGRGVNARRGTVGPTDASNVRDHRLEAGADGEAHRRAAWD